MSDAKEAEEANESSENQGIMGSTTHPTGSLNLENKSSMPTRRLD
jgi:hypothetical protein